MRSVTLRRLAVAGLFLLVPACQQDMARQPSYRKPLQPSSFFPDGRSARPIPAGTVARGRPREDSPLVRFQSDPKGDLGRARSLADKARMLCDALGRQ